ncbi:hypothetical protein KC19_7G100500 [Ceratodon purpureus]|uniref:Lipoxygenase n=1 Tax=Ceratodon purpureus TaxID=3225 RepID=A0A8T0H9H7_CERPU|nr:hypothetical protein KC19_7G100500 [Ceratodon purpureus]KAG0566968.1 hypothetical protein KC19_7G100500 [Ceratodon purpureus]
MAALASCIGARAVLRRPSTIRSVATDPEPPSTKPTVQIPQTGNANGAGTLMSRHDLVNIFARDAPLAKAKPATQADGTAAPAWAPKSLVKSAVSEVDSVTKKFEDLFHKLVPGGVDSDDLDVIQGDLIVQKKILALDLANAGADKADDVDECAGRHVSIQIVSTKVDPTTKKPFTSDEVAIKNWIKTKDTCISAKFGFTLEFKVPKDFGKPGAIIVKNRHQNEFLLDSFKLTMPDNDVVNFPADTWIYNNNQQQDPGRILFSNELYLPSDTPDGLVPLREMELENLRGDGKGERKFNDRIYDYDVYNDLGDPDGKPGWFGGPLPRPVLGGSQELPYPRRCRTGRPPCENDPKSESKGDLLAFYYIPRDEKFDQVKFSDFAAESVRGAQHGLIPALQSHITGNNEFESLEEIKRLYAKRGAKLDVPNNLIPRNSASSDEIPGESQPLTFIHEYFFPTGPDTNLITYPLPDVIGVDDKAWNSDVEFGREMLAGVNPLVIQRLKDFPIKSTLDQKEFGDPKSAITKDIIEQGIKNIEGGHLSVQKALDQNRLFIQDYHDIFLPYINKINSQNLGKMYATRTVLFLTKENTLMPLAIELTLPPAKKGGEKNSRVFTPEMEKDGVWSLAKAHVSSCDTSYHEVISHFLRTHACIEPFIIATNRHLSVLHPVHRVLVPHYKNTMDINASARKALVNAGGIIEDNFTPGQYTMEMSSVVYKLDWRFDEQALPEDLIKRGMAERDPKAPHGVKLVLSDYPYAADGLELWGALKDYMTDHIKLFYDNDKAVTQDKELQNWWTEARTVGHADKKDAPGWPTLNSIESLAYTLTTIAWIASCHHAAVNFGQYPYGGYMPNRPSMTRKLIPEEGTLEYELLKDPKQWERAFLDTISNQSQATIVMGTLEILSTHAVDEEYLGQRVSPNWSNDPKVLDAFAKFSQKIADVEKLIGERNSDKSLKNRTGPVQLPYGLLLPNSPTAGLTGKGVPYSISI